VGRNRHSNAKGRDRGVVVKEGQRDCRQGQENKLCAGRERKWGRSALTSVCGKGEMKGCSRKIEGEECCGMEMRDCYK
jgi:hypothetical protein